MRVNADALPCIFSISVAAIIIKTRTTMAPKLKYLEIFFTSTIIKRLNRFDEFNYSVSFFFGEIVEFLSRGIRIALFGIGVPHYRFDDVSCAAVMKTVRSAGIGC